MAGALAIYGGLALFLFENTWRDPTHRVVGVGGDVGVYLWYLRWVPFALGGGHTPLLSSYLLYPHGINLMWNTSVLSPALLAAPITMAVGAAAAYNVLLTASFALSSWFAFLAFRRYASSAVAAGIGGLIYGFSPYMISQGFSHLNLTVAVFPPLALLCLDEMFIRQGPRTTVFAALLGAVAAFQLLASEEILASAVIVASFGVVLLALLNPRQIVREHLRHALRPLAYSLVAFLVLASYPLFVQFFGPHRVHGLLQPRNVYVTDLYSLVVPSDRQHFTTAHATAIANRFTSGVEETDGYLGLPLLLVLIIATVRLWRLRLIRFVSLLAVVLIVLSLGSTLHLGGRTTGIRLPWSLVDHLPVLENLLPTRLMLYVFLLVALEVSVIADLASRAEPRWRRAVIAAAIVLALLPLVPRYPYPTHPIDVPPFFTKQAAGTIAEGSAAYLPTPTGGDFTDPMVWQEETDFRFRLIGGSAFNPGAHGPAYGLENFGLDSLIAAGQRGETQQITPAQRRSVLTELTAARVQTVVLGPMEHQQEIGALLKTVLGRAPDETQGGVSLWTGIGDKP